MLMPLDWQATWATLGSSPDLGQILGEDSSYNATRQEDAAAATNGVGVISLNIEHNPAFDVAKSMLEGNYAIKDYFVDKHSNNNPPLNFTEFKFYDSPTYWDWAVRRGHGIGLCCL
jgi:hypothetical protein